MGSAFRTAGLETLAADLHRMRVNTTQSKAAFKEIAELLAAAQRRHFSTEGRYYGTPWAKLDPDTVRRKGHNRILEDTGRLRRSIAPARAAGFDYLRFTNSGVEVGTDLPYAVHAHTGGPHTPARPLTGELPPKDQQAIAEALHRHITKGTRHARS